MTSKLNLGPSVKSGGKQRALVVGVVILTLLLLLLVRRPKEAAEASEVPNAENPPTTSETEPTASEPAQTSPPPGPTGETANSATGTSGPAESSGAGPSTEGKPWEVEVPPLPLQNLPADTKPLTEEPYRLQVVMERLGFSSGVIDGQDRIETRLALNSLRAAHGLVAGESLPETPEVSALLSKPLETTVALVRADFADLKGNSKDSASLHSNILERLAERVGAHPSVLVRLNPGVNWSALNPGKRIRLPETERVKMQESGISLVRISLSGGMLQVFGASGRTIFFTPARISPTARQGGSGTLKVVRHAVLQPVELANPDRGGITRHPPGPNNPLGSARIILDREDASIHGTSDPDDPSAALACGYIGIPNRSIEYLVRIVPVGTSVIVAP